MFPEREKTEILFFPASISRRSYSLETIKEKKNPKLKLPVIKRTTL